VLDAGPSQRLSDDLTEVAGADDALEEAPMASAVA
jgi:hypothetical protein